MALTILVALFTIPAQLLIHYFVTPKYLNEAQNYMIKAGEMSQSQAQEFFTITNFVVIFPLLYLLLGTFLSILFANILQQKKKKRRKS